MKPLPSARRISPRPAAGSASFRASCSRACGKVVFATLGPGLAMLPGLATCTLQAVLAGAATAALAGTPWPRSNRCTAGRPQRSGRGSRGLRQHGV
jgi:hypothetical protein